MADGRKGIAIDLEAFEGGVTVKVGVLYRGNIDCFKQSMMMG